MNQVLKKQILTHGLIILSFYIITLLLHLPSIFEGESLSQHDILQAQGMNHQLKEYEAKTGETALWNNYMFSGMPSYFAGLNFPGDLMSYVFKFISAGLTAPFNLVFLSMVSFYVLLLTFKVRPLLAGVGAVAFALNGFNIISLIAGHNSKIAAVAFMPLVLAGIKLVFDRKRVLGFGLSALALTLEVKSNHPQITYYLVLIVMAFGINELIKAVKEKRIKDFATNVGVIVIASILAIGANFGRLATTLEYSKYSNRGKSELSSNRMESSGLDREYAFRFSNGIVEPLFLFIPNIYGGSSSTAFASDRKSETIKALRRSSNPQVANQLAPYSRAYWGDQPHTAPYYAGTFTVILFILGILVLPKNKKVWLIILVCLGIVLSWGKNFETFNYFIFDYLPGYNKFRSVTFTIIISIFSMNLLGFIALEKLFSSEWNTTLKKKIFTLFVVLGTVLLGILIISGGLNYKGAFDAQLPDWFLDALKKDRKTLLRKDVLRTLMFAVSFAVLAWALLKKNAKANYVTLGIFIILFIDNFSLSKRFLNEDKFTKDPSAEYFTKTEADYAMISFGQEGERVLNLQNPFNEARTSYYHESVGGYHGAKIKRYQELIDYCIQSELQTAFDKLRSQSGDFSNLNVLNMLNTKFFYAGNQYFQNTSANGNAWTVQNLIEVNNPTEEVSKICSINTKQSAIIDASKFSIPKVSGSGTINLVEKTPNKVTYEANIQNGNALGVFSEIYYPEGWTATINGDPTEILRANYVLRALEIPNGQHEIVFEFQPKSYVIGNSVMMVSSILVMLVFIGGAAHEIRGRFSS